MTCREAIDVLADYLDATPDPAPELRRRLTAFLLERLHGSAD